MSVDSQARTVGLEKGDSNNSMGHEDMLERVRTASTITIPPEIFEQMFLSPENKVKGQLRQTLANPTPIGKQY